MLRFNTAIFYDIENLTKGSSTKAIVKALSLTAIYEKIIALDFVEKICLQRAYANWSDFRFSHLKDEINALGIDPIQIFGFSQFQIKNAADIQLVVDAMEVNFNRALIDTYVIVSGDGGFSSLVKKLHEYNRRVVVCAYGSATNRNLKAVADYFIELDEPEEDRNGSYYVPKPLPQGINHPLVVSLAHSIEPLRPDEVNQDLIFHTARAILNWFREDSEAQKKLKKEGIHLSVIREAFKYVIPDFKSEKVGFAKFIEFLQFLCTDTEVCVGTVPPSNTFLCLREHLIDQFQLLPDLLPEHLHSKERYQQLLTHGKPKIAIASRPELDMVCSFWLDRPTASLSITECLQLLSQEFPAISGETIHNLLFTLIHTGILVGHPPDVQMSEQVFCLRTDIHYREDILHLIYESAKDKLSSILGQDFDLDIFATALNL